VQSTVATGCRESHNLSYHMVLRPIEWPHEVMKRIVALPGRGVAEGKKALMGLHF
jgi:hypothetical protein